MNLEDIQELGHAAATLATVANSLTDEALKDRMIRQAGIVADAHDELLALHRMRAGIEVAVNQAVEDMAKQEVKFTVENETL